MNILALTGKNRGEVDRYIRDEWGGPIMVTLGNLFDTGTLPGLVALEEEQVVGAILYRIEGDDCEMTVLYALRSHCGIGTALVDALLAIARIQGCRRVWLVTTNDNTPAIRF